MYKQFFDNLPHPTIMMFSVATGILIGAGVSYSLGYNAETQNKAAGLGCIASFAILSFYSIASQNYNTMLQQNNIEQDIIGGNSPDN
ncbi:MAG: hypothetical protein HRU36_02055 [Rickettsiales bacterium]|nr:hypothetical protein [Rickettsiales bacterium]